MNDTIRGRAAGGLVHPGVAFAVALLVLNDHVLKAAFPGAVTGKLSDFAGLAFFPLLLEALLETLLAAVGRYRGPSRPRLLGCIVVTGLAFAWMKTTPLGARTYSLGLGAIHWPLSALVSYVRGETPSPFVPAPIVRDPSDLSAIFSLFFAYRFGIARPLVHHNDATH